MDANADVSITISARPNSTIQRRMPIREIQVYICMAMVILPVAV